VSPVGRIYLGSHCRTPSTEYGDVHCGITHTTAGRGADKHICVRVVCDVEELSLDRVEVLPRVERLPGLVLFHGAAGAVIL
jgi:hypothetical protein